MLRFALQQLSSVSTLIGWGQLTRCWAPKRLCSLSSSWLSHAQKQTGSKAAALYNSSPVPKHMAEIISHLYCLLGEGGSLPGAGPWRDNVHCHLLGCLKQKSRPTCVLLMSQNCFILFISFTKELRKTKDLGPEQGKK